MFESESIVDILAATGSASVVNCWVRFDVEAVRERPWLGDQHEPGPFTNGLHPGA